MVQPMSVNSCKIIAALVVSLVSAAQADWVLCVHKGWPMYPATNVPENVQIYDWSNEQSDETKQLIAGFRRRNGGVLESRRDGVEFYGPGDFEPSAYPWLVNEDGRVAMQVIGSVTNTMAILLERIETERPSNIKVATNAVNLLITTNNLTQWRSRVMAQINALPNGQQKSALVDAISYLMARDALAEARDEEAKEKAKKRR